MHLVLKKKPPVKETKYPDAVSARIGHLVQIGMKVEPIEFDGHIWAKGAQDDWAESAECSVSTFQRKIKRPPFAYECIMLDGKKVTLVRIGTPDTETPRVIAKRMAKLFKKKTGIRPNKNCFGCLCGLADVWPKNMQIEILSAVLSDWSAYMAGVGMEIDFAIDKGEKLPGQTSDLAPKKFYHEFPHIPTIRLFPHVAVELYVMQMQAKAA